MRGTKIQVIREERNTEVRRTTKLTGRRSSPARELWFPAQHEKTSTVTVDHQKGVRGTEDDEEEEMGHPTRREMKEKRLAFVLSSRRKVACSRTHPKRGTYNFPRIGAGGRWKAFNPRPEEWGENRNTARVSFVSTWICDDSWTTSRRHPRKPRKVARPLDTIKR